MLPRGPGPLRVIVTGSRSWYCPALAELVVGRLVAKHSGSLVIVHGDAPGVDRSFAEAAEAAEDAGVGPRRGDCKL